LQHGSFGIILLKVGQPDVLDEGYNLKSSNLTRTIHVKNLVKRFDEIGLFAKFDQL